MNPKQNNNRGFTLVELLVVIAIIVTLAGVGAPVILGQKKKADLNQAVQNSKQIGLAMQGFNDDYGSFPDDASAEEVEENNPDATYTYTGGDSNAYFRQLIGAGLIDQEGPFYAKAPYTKKPDNSLDGTDAIDAGECGFAYIMDGTDAIPTGNSARPLIVAAVEENKTDGSFDVEVYGKKAVLYRLDNSAAEVTVRTSDKKALLGGGKTLTDTGADTVWGTDITPTIKAPEPK
jgi:prepilin-type N-terminal cleavage/methylation domain-containing protein